jgi:hypothetical protein
VTVIGFSPPDRFGTPFRAFPPIIAIFLRKVTVIKRAQTAGPPIANGLIGPATVTKGR